MSCLSLFWQWNWSGFFCFNSQLFKEEGMCTSFSSHSLSQQRGTLFYIACTAKLLKMSSVGSWFKEKIPSWTPPFLHISFLFRAQESQLPERSKFTEGIEHVTTSCHLGKARCSSASPPSWSPCGVHTPPRCSEGTAWCLGAVLTFGWGAP